MSDYIEKPCRGIYSFLARSNLGEQDQILLEMKATALTTNVP